jgi:hypothetical protein
LFVPAVILSAAKDPDTVPTTHSIASAHSAFPCHPNPKVTKILSSPQVTQKREIPNNDAPFKFKENGRVTTLKSLQLT